MGFSSGRIRYFMMALACVLVVAGIAYLGVTYAQLNSGTNKSATCLIQETNSVIEVNTDASVHATEHRTYTMTKDSSFVVWDLTNITSRQNLIMQSVRVTQLDADGQSASTTELSKTPFSNLWREGTSLPEFDCYAVDTSWKQLYVITPFQTGQVMISIDYIIEEAVTPYRDASDTSWTLVAGTNSASTPNSSVTVVLPVPKGEEDPSSSILAWGHGPNNAALSVSEDGIITYSVSETQVWQYAELRYIFPTTWLSNLDTHYASYYNTTLHLNDVLLSEAKWTDTWHLRSINSYGFDMWFIAICVALIAASLLLYLRYGKPHDPDFTGEHWNKPPYCDEAIHPSSVGQIWRWNRQNVFDLHAAFNYLAIKKAIVITPENISSDQIDFSLTKNQDACKDLRPIDVATLDLLFTTISQGNDRLTSKQLEQFKKTSTRDYKNALYKWHRALGSQFDQDLYFEPQGRRWQTRLLLIALFVAIAGMGMNFLLGHTILLASGLITGITIALLANYLPRRTRLGNNITARAKALRKWILAKKDSADQIGPQELAALMPYACLFDLKETAIDQANQLLPEEQRIAADRYNPEEKLWTCCYLTTQLLNQEEEA